MHGGTPEDRSQPRRAIIVAGMHRSGTSAVTRVLGLLGAALPRRMIAPLAENETGFWEPEPIVRLHDELLASLGSAWDDPTPIPGQWFASRMARSFEERLVLKLTEEYGDARLLAVKDPRVCRLVPLWASALERFGAEPSFVIPIRNPLEVAASLAGRNDFATGKSLLLWLQHLLDAERDTRSFDRAFLTLEGLLESWRSEVERMSHELSLP